MLSNPKIGDLVVHLFEICDYQLDGEPYPRLGHIIDIDKSKNIAYILWSGDPSQLKWEPLNSLFDAIAWKSNP